MPTSPQRFISLAVLVLVTLTTLPGCAPRANKTVQPLPTTETSSSNQCMNNFTLLQKLNPSAYTKYQAQFNKINDSYHYYQKNRGLLEKDPSELIELNLNDKLNMICERVKSQTFIEHQQRMKVISTI
ncbi:hypothetical protein [Candidatus Regiella insecticola]|nr:hypothetical protein [Candidatus Regiella insecticola]